VIAAHPSLKDAAASIATAYAHASDDQMQLGAQDSVVRYLKHVIQSEAPDRKERMVVYPDVIQLIQIAWEFGPNGNVSCFGTTETEIGYSVDGGHGGSVYA
jgi:hypothetical protein